MIRALVLFLIFISFSSCRYSLGGGERIAISVPYVVGDFEGELTDSLIWAIARTPSFKYCHGEGNWILTAKILGTDNERIGYRYDQDEKTKVLKNNLLGIENRKTITVEITVTSSATGEKIIGPQVIKASADYDYADPNSLADLSFENFNGKRATAIDFSLGQLDTVGSAGEDAIYPIYRRLAQKIVEGMLATGD